MGGCKYEHNHEYAYEFDYQSNWECDCKYECKYKFECEFMFGYDLVYKYQYGLMFKVNLSIVGYSHIQLSLGAQKLADENVIMVFPWSVFPLILHYGDHPNLFNLEFRGNYHII